MCDGGQGINEMNDAQDYQSLLDCIMAEAVGCPVAHEFVIVTDTRDDYA